MKAQNRKEIFLKAIANGEKTEIKPLTREEILLKKQAERESSGSGASDCDWNTMKNKPFGEETAEVALFDEQTIEFSRRESDGWLAHKIEPKPFDLVEGQTYKVTWDGTEYECVAQYTDENNDDYTSLYIGNPYKIDGKSLEDNGLPFVIEVRPYSDSTNSMTKNQLRISCGTDSFGDPNETHTISISTVETIVETIDPKFIPDTIARVEDMNVLTSSNGTKYSLSISDDGTLTANPV